MSKHCQEVRSLLPTSFVRHYFVYRVWCLFLYLKNKIKYVKSFKYSLPGVFCSLKPLSFVYCSLNCYFKTISWGFICKWMQMEGLNARDFHHWLISTFGSTDMICRAECFFFLLVPDSLGHKKERVRWKLAKYFKSITIVKIILLLGKCILIVFSLSALPSATHTTLLPQGKVSSLRSQMHWSIIINMGMGWKRKGKGWGIQKLMEADWLIPWLKQLFQGITKSD